MEGIRKVDGKWLIDGVYTGSESETYPSTIGLAVDQYGDNWVNEVVNAVDYLKKQDVLAVKNDTERAAVEFLQEKTNWNGRVDDPTKKKEGSPEQKKRKTD